MQTLHLKPDIGVPYEPAEKYVDLVERATAACQTMGELEQYGAQWPLADEDREMAAVLATAYAEDPEEASKSVSNTKAAGLRPASIILANRILTEFSENIVAKSTHIRNLVTNKLLLETEHKDARVRLKAIELLGKLSDVGAFTEKAEITVTHQSSDDLRDKLREKLHRLVDPNENITDITPE